MRDVAERAGVSLKTVSRVINDEPGVATATAERVALAIGEMGFRRNDLARSLRRGGSSATLGLLIEDVANPFYSAIAQAVEAAARERGYLVFTASCEEDPVRERELVVAFVRRRVDALLLVPTGAGGDHGWLARELGTTTPVIFLDRPPQGHGGDAVLLDNAGGARAAVEHLLAHGHERIAFLADPDTVFTARERLSGYRAALGAAGVTERPGLVRTGTREAESAAAVVRELLALDADRRPTALFCANNRHTVGALRALQTAPRGEAIAVVGFDDFELSDLLARPVTVVRFDAAAMGAHAAELAFARLDGDGRPARRIVIPTEIVPRGSGEVAPTP